MASHGNQRSFTTKVHHPTKVHHQGSPLRERQIMKKSSSASPPPPSPSPPPASRPLEVPATTQPPMTAQGFAIANHIHNGYNGDTSASPNGIGWLRSEMTGAEISAGSLATTSDYAQSDTPRSATTADVPHTYPGLGGAQRRQRPPPPRRGVGAVARTASVCSIRRFGRPSLPGTGVATPKARGGGPEGIAGARLARPACGETGTPCETIGRRRCTP